MKWFVSLLATIVWASLGAQNTDQKPSVDYRVMIEQESAYDFDLDGLQKSEWIIDSEASLKFSKKVKLFGQLRLYTELADRLEPGRPDYTNYSSFSKPLRLGKKGQLELRELYADLTIGKSYWRVGKQQVVWGEMDGLKILDILNPMSFREFILDDFDDSRIPLWAIKGDIKIGSLNVQAYWSPDITSHHFPSNGGLYGPPILIGEAPSEVSVEMQELKRPGKFFKDSDIGVQVSTMLKGWDVAFNYVYQYDKFPVFKRAFDQGSQTLMVWPTLKRQHLAGGSFGRTVGLFGLRAEMAFLPKKHVMTYEVNNNHGLHRTKQLLSGIAIDYFGISDAILTFQWFADYLKGPSDESLLERKNTTHTLTTMLTKYMMNQRVELEIFGGYRFNEKAMLLDIKTSYLIKDNFKVWIGGDLFTGQNQGLIGSFNNRDRISLGMEWGFQSKSN
jgi:hypothetical protein